MTGSGSALWAERINRLLLGRAGIAHHAAQRLDLSSPARAREYLRAACGLVNTCDDRAFIDSVRPDHGFHRFDASTPMRTEVVDLALHLYLRMYAPLAFDQTGRLERTLFIDFLAANLDVSREELDRAVPHLEAITLNAQEAQAALNHTRLNLAPTTVAVRDVLMRAHVIAYAHVLEWRGAGGHNILHLIVAQQRGACVQALREGLDPASYASLLYDEGSLGVSPFGQLLQSRNCGLASELIGPQQTLEIRFLQWAGGDDWFQCDETIRLGFSRALVAARLPDGGNVFHLLARVCSAAVCAGLVGAARCAGHPEALDLLRTQDHARCTPLDVALACGNVAFVSWSLLDGPGGTPEDRQDYRGNGFADALKQVMENSRSQALAIVEHLCRARAWDGANLLHVAARCLTGYTQLPSLRKLAGLADSGQLAALLCERVRVNHTGGGNGQTPLELARAHSNACFLLWCIVDGVRPALPVAGLSMDGLPLRRAVPSVGAHELVQRVFARAVGLLEGMEVADTAVLQLLVSGELGEHRPDSVNALHVAVASVQDLRVMDQLYRVMGADRVRSAIQVPHPCGKTPLGLAASCRNLDFVDWLIEWGEPEADFLLRHPQDMEGLDADVKDYLFRCGFSGRNVAQACRSTVLALRVAPNAATYLGLIHGTFPEDPEQASLRPESPASLASRSRHRLPRIEDRILYARLTQELMALARARFDQPSVLQPPMPFEAFAPELWDGNEHALTEMATVFDQRIRTALREHFASQGTPGRATPPA